VPHPVFAGGLRREITPLVNLLVEEMRRRGFDFQDPGCWGYACRGTKDSSGNVGGTPSFHSWGLAIDINAPKNPFGAARENTQLGTAEYAWVTKLMREYGFFWLGPSIGDWMHYSFVGNKRDARRMLKKARANLVVSTEFRYRGTTYSKVRGVLRRLKRGLRGSKAGDEHEIYVRKQQG
jgi:hypothetical protein